MISSVRYFAVLCICILVSFSVTPVSAAGGNTITLTMPSAALHQTISNMLPMSLEQIGQQKRFEGTITVDSISRLAVKENTISLQAQLSGRNMKMTTSIGGQNIQVKLGQLVLPVTCDIALRFDTKKKRLFLTPQFKNPDHGKSNSAKTLLPLLNGLSREYPVPLDNLAPFTGQIGSQTVSARMEIVNIKAAKNNLIIQFRPAQKRVVKR